MAEVVSDSSPLEALRTGLSMAAAAASGATTSEKREEESVTQPLQRQNLAAGSSWRETHWGG